MLIKPGQDDQLDASCSASAGQQRGRRTLPGCQGLPAAHDSQARPRLAARGRGRRRLALEAMTSDDLPAADLAAALWASSRACRLVPPPETRTAIGLYHSIHALLARDDLAQTDAAARPAAFRTSSGLVRLVARGRRRIMPMPMLKVLYISRSGMLPVSWMRSKMGGTGTALFLMLGASCPRAGCGGCFHRSRRR